MRVRRRAWLRSISRWAIGSGVACASRPALAGSTPGRPATAPSLTPPAPERAQEALRSILQEFAEGRPIEMNSGRVRLEIDPLVENGNSVPVRVVVRSAMTPQDHVQGILILAPRNPQPQVARFHLGPHNGRAEVATRFRMAESQSVQALVRCSDGSVLHAQVEVIVTLAACLES